ncbi:MAG: MFS transporter [Dehalococcoidales bacterium]|nr:MFS transporter [Dehalococcoidales bacterium]
MDDSDETKGDDGIKRPRYSGGVLSFSLAKTFVSFKNPIYRLYYFSMVGHWSSLNMMNLARSLLVYRITGSGAILGILALANAIPMILLTLPGGVAADRFQKKNIIQVCQILSILISLAITIVLLTGYLGPEHPDSWWVLVVSGALQGAVMGFMLPARSSIISEIVEPDNLMNAISLNNLGMNVFRVISPALAGFIIDAFDFWVAYAIMTVMIIMSWVFVIFVPPTSKPTKVGGNSLADILEGWRYIRSEKTIFMVLIFTVLVIILGSPYGQLLPMFTEDILKVSATDMGILVAVSGVGAIVGSLILASLMNRKRGLILLFSGLLLGVALIVFSFSSWWFLSLGVIVFVGLASTIQMALGNSLVQYYTDAMHRGRVMSFLMLGFGLGSLGSFFAGLMAEGIGAPWSVGGLAILLVVVTVFIMATSKRLRVLD